MKYLEIKLNPHILEIITTNLEDLLHKIKVHLDTTNSVGEDKHNKDCYSPTDK